MAQFVGDVFGLNAVYDKQLENIANGNFASWPEGATYGYFAGGIPPNTGISSIDRLDFFTEVLSSPGTPLGRDTNEFDGFSSSLYGYFGGGDSPSTPSASNVDRLDFSTETISNPGNYLSPARQTLAATSNTSYGYFVGGVDGSTGSLVSTITRFDFSNETLTNSPTRNLPTTISDLAATSSSSYGYFAGGSNATPRFANVRSSISRLDFSSDVVSSTTPLSPSRCSLAAVSSSAYGYFGGGQISIPTSISTISTIDFSTDNLRFAAFLLTPVSLLSATSGNFYGYFAGGGGQPGALPIISNIYRLDFSNSTISDSNPLSIGKYSLAALSGGQSTLRNKGFKTYGYFGGGGPAGVSTIDRIDLSTNSVNLSGYLSFGIEGNSGVSNNNYGYFAFGTRTPSVLNNGTVFRLDFSNDSVSTSPNPSPSNVTYISSFSSNSYGYFAAGSGTNTITRLDFSSETFNLPNKNLPLNLDGTTSTSSNSFGYVAGGWSPIPATFTLSSNIYRIDFLTESVKLATTFPTYSGISGRTYSSAVSSNLYGYFCGGANILADVGYSLIQRLDFSIETISTPVVFLPATRVQAASVSGNSYAYIAGGSPTVSKPFTAISSIVRFNFSTETASNTSPASVLSNAVADFAGLSNSN